MQALAQFTCSQALGAARHIDEYAEAGARYRNTKQQGVANTQRAYASDWQFKAPASSVQTTPGCAS